MKQTKKRKNPKKKIKQNYLIHKIKTALSDIVYDTVHLQGVSCIMKLKPIVYMKTGTALCFVMTRSFFNSRKEACEKMIIIIGMYHPLTPCPPLDPHL